MIIIFEPVLKWEALRSAIQACLEQKVPFGKWHHIAAVLSHFIMKFMFMF